MPLFSLIDFRRHYFHTSCRYDAARADVSAAIDAADSCHAAAARDITLMMPPLLLLPLPLFVCCHTPFRR